MLLLLKTDINDIDYDVVIINKLNQYFVNALKII